MSEVKETCKPNKRGRKAKSVNFKNNKDTVINNFEMQETVILHLPVSLDKLINSIKNVQKKCIEDILSEYPSELLQNNTVNKNIDKIINSVNGNQPYTVDKRFQKYTETNSKGQNETIKVYEASFLPYEKDYENVKRIKVEKTNVACWWCCHQFDTFPVCAPLRYDSRKDVFTVIGCFCSFNCSKSFLLTEYNSRHELNSYLYRRIVNQYKHVKKAPCKTVLKMFGGPLSIEEYRETFDMLADVKINKYPMVYMPNQIQYNKVDNNFKNNIKPETANNKNYLTDKKIQEVVKRKTNSKTENKKNNSNNLMKLMGIKYKTSTGA